MRYQIERRRVSQDDIVKGREVRRLGEVVRRGPRSLAVPQVLTISDNDWAAIR